MESKTELSCEKLESQAFKLVIEQDGKEVGRAFLFLITNQLNDKPYGLLEDLFVDESCRSQGLGKRLVGEIIEKAKEVGCYKLIATSRHERPKVHELYLKFGFRDYGKEFRMDF